MPGLAACIIWLSLHIKYWLVMWSCSDIWGLLPDQTTAESAWKKSAVEHGIFFFFINTVQWIHYSVTNLFHLSLSVYLSWYKSSLERICLFDLSKIEYVSNTLTRSNSKRNSTKDSMMVKWSIFSHGLWLLHNKMTYLWSSLTLKLNTHFPDNIAV